MTKSAPKICLFHFAMKAGPLSSVERRASAYEGIRTPSASQRTVAFASSLPGDVLRGTPAASPRPHQRQAHTP